MKIIASDKGPGILTGLIGKIVHRNAVAKGGCLVSGDLDDEIPGLMMDRLERLQPLLPAVGNLFWRQGGRLASDHRRHIEMNLRRKAFFDPDPISLIGPEEQAIDGLNDPVFFREVL